MKIRFLALGALLVAGSILPATAATAPYARMKWREIGPAITGGRVSSVAGTAQNANLYVIGTAGGGVWKSSNGGATWKPIFTKEPTGAIGAVAIDPTNQNVLWVGTGESNPRNDVSFGTGLYKSTNGGKTWERVGLALTRQISRIAVDPKNPQHVVVGASGDPYADSVHRGVYVTFDGGKTWTKSLYIGPSSGASDIAMDPADPNIVFAGMWQFRRKPWTFHSGGPNDGIYKSTDGGKSWTKLVGNGLPAGYEGRIGLAIAPSNPSRVYALIEAKGGILWRSDDAGAHWKMMTDNTLVDQRPFYFTHIAVDPKNENRVYGVSEMLSVSTDGGKKFKSIAKGVHVDYHAIWIAPNNGKRIIVGEDGGYALTLDGGKAWSFARNLPIGQVYHVGLSNGNPYLVCGGWQDNSGWCGPSNSRDRQGIKNRRWFQVVGGDGMWAVPDPSDANDVVADLEDGYVNVFNRHARLYRFINPYFEPGLSIFDLNKRPYRFNWDSPIAFAPWNGHVLWYGGNVVFQSTDLGQTWHPISPDLTRNIKAHQMPAGGPLAHDVSGAEYSDTILDIEGSPIARGEIWVGTDDGLVQLTRDGGKHWQNVTPAGAPTYARVETVAPSALDPATAYASFDDHRMGDYAPYLYVTHDYGKSWTKIVNGLPANIYARTIRPDIHNKNLVFAGNEEGLFISFNGGGTWKPFSLNVPAVSVRDIRIQPTFDDLVIATHGRGIWILDDIAAIQNLPAAQAKGAMLFPVRTAYEYIMHSNDENLYTRYAAKNPPAGAILDFYQKAPQKKSPIVQVLDARGRVIRTISGSIKIGKKKISLVPNKAGINRVVWDLRENGVPRWMGAARKAYRGPKEGLTVLPGRYTARILLNGHTFTQSFQVKADPQTPYTLAQMRAGYRIGKHFLDMSGKINVVLDALDAQNVALKKAYAIARSADNAPRLAALSAAMKRRDTIFATFTANYQNDEDSIQRPGALREAVPGGFFLGGNTPPTASLLAYRRHLDVRFAAAMDAYHRYLATVIKPLGLQIK